MESNESSCLHVKDIAFHAKNPNRAPPPHMSIFSLVKGGKEHEVFEMRMCGGGPEQLRKKENKRQPIPGRIQGLAACIKYSKII